LMRMILPPSLTRAGPAWGADAFPPAVRAVLPDGLRGELQPLPLPMAVSGMGSGAAPLLPMLRGATFIPVQAPVAAAGQPEQAAAQEVNLEPGVPVGAVFVSGDLDIAGMGTLTWIEGDDALAFGHALFGAGEVDVPLAVGEVQAIVPSMYRSFKLTTTGPVVGRIVQDREASIMAKIGQAAPTFACTARIRGTVEEQYNYRVAGYWETAPMFASVALASSSERWEGGRNRYSLSAKVEMRLKGRAEPVVLRNRYSSFSLMPPTLDLVAFPMQVLLLNPFEETQIESLDFELDIEPGFETARIDSAWADRSRVAPGETLSVYVRLREYRGEEAVREFHVQIPQSAEPGTEVMILVCDAMVNRMIKRGLDPGFFSPRDFEGMVEMLEAMEPNANLVLRASVAELGVRIGGEAMPALPPSALSLLRYGASAGRSTPLLTDIELSVETPWVLSGAQTLSVSVKEPEPYEP
ncbi:MAG: hypothetical protein ACYS1C_08650, partial [Planctomycetota bacterium]